MSSELSRRLLFWYRSHRRFLPWRQTRDPYKILVSEVMLQQTTVAAVIPYYERWIRVFPTFKKLSQASWGKVLKHWQGLGYYARARNLYKTARLVVDTYGGNLPEDPQILRNLPGFGPYTTAAVVSIAFGKPDPVIDANVRRLMSRVLAIRSKKSSDEPMRVFLKQHIPLSDAGDFNQALMELGALICKPSDPLCLSCPWQRSCLSKKKGIEHLIPLKKKKILKKIRTVVAILKKGNRVFFQQRPDQGLLAGFWELPGGKIEKGETEQEALARELKEELGVDLRKAVYKSTIWHSYTCFQVTLSAWECEVYPEPRLDKTHRWISEKGLKKYPLPSGTVKLLKKMGKEWR